MKQLTLSFKAVFNKTVEATDEFYDKLINALDASDVDAGSHFAQDADKWTEMLNSLKAKADKIKSAQIHVGPICGIGDNETGEIIAEF